MKDVAIALLLVAGAGSATALGAMVVFFPSLVKYANTRTLAGGLGLSAGVMTYVSFVEIFQKSIRSFVDGGHALNMANVYATGCFFAGVILMVTLNYCVTALLGGHHHHHHGTVAEDAKKQRKTQSELSRGSSLPIQSACACCSDDPVHDLQQIQQMAQEMEDKEGSGDEGDKGESDVVDVEHQNRDEELQNEDEVQNDEEEQNNNEEKLMRMSINTALAIALHNFPEGLATFVATLNDPKVGAVLATAIAIHNIPEGLCVAMPIYYATGNRWKAFRWGVLSGISEPIAALLGWAVLANAFGDILYAIMFGSVAGMMVIISMRELLPTAHRYDPEDSVVTYSFIAGMFVMALSLVLFLL